MASTKLFWTSILLILTCIIHSFAMPVADSMQNANMDRLMELMGYDFDGLSEVQKRGGFSFHGARGKKSIPTEKRYSYLPARGRRAILY